jgi:hypothetical protein
MSYGSEDAEYWQHAKKSIRCDLPALSVSEGKPFIKQAIALVAEFVQTPNSLLIVDEWAYIASTANPHRESLVGLLNDISSQITSLSSAGIKRQRGLWAISPEFVAGSLVPQGKAVKKLQLVYVTIHPDRLVDWNGSAIGFSDELFQQVANNFPVDLPDSMELPDCDRIVYIDRQWLPVGKLPTLKSPQVEKPSTDQRESLEKLYQETESDNGELEIRAEIKRFLSANPEGSKPRDLSNKARSPVRKMSVDDIRFTLEVMELEGDIYSVQDAFFLNRL